MSYKDLIIQDLPEKRKEGECLIGFTRKLKDGKRIKYAHIGVYLVRNPQSEEYGRFAVMAWFLNATRYYNSFTIALRVARSEIEKLKEEYLSGKRNWWTSKIKESGNK